MRMKYEQTLTRTLGLESRWERNWFCAGFILLMMYLELIILGQNILAERPKRAALPSAAAAALFGPELPRRMSLTNTPRR